MENSEQEQEEEEEEQEEQEQEEMSQEYYAAACLFTILCAGAYAKLFLIKNAQHDSKLRGKDYYEEVTRTCNRNRFFEVARMPYESFIKFVKLLVEHGELDGSQNVHAGEMTLMYMNSLMATSLAKQAERWP